MKKSMPYPLARAAGKIKNMRFQFWVRARVRVAVRVEEERLSVQVMGGHLQMTTDLGRDKAKKRSKKSQIIALQAPACRKAGGIG
jgi:hypothetical protein